MRLVMDTSVVISAALLPRSLPRQVFDAAVSHGALLVSETTVIELDDVFRRPKFNKYTTEETRLEFLAALVRIAELIKIAEPIAACRDPKDDKFLELAVSGRATHLISSDSDLLVLHPFRGIDIVTPQAFLALIQAKDDVSAQS